MHYSYRSLEPQAQVIWQKQEFDDRSDAFSTVAFDVDDMVTARLGLRLFRSAENARWRPYLKINVWHGFAGTDTVAGL